MPAFLFYCVEHICRTGAVADLRNSFSAGGLKIWRQGVTVMVGHGMEAGCNGNGGARYGGGL